jgi:hypothetical protein
METAGCSKKAGARERWGGRLSQPAQVPCPLGEVDMDERIADRAKAAAHIPCKLLRRERLHAIEQAVAGPVVVVEHNAQVLQIHVVPPDNGSWLQAFRLILSEPSLALRASFFSSCPLHSPPLAYARGTDLRLSTYL